MGVVRALRDQGQTARRIAALRFNQLERELDLLRGDHSDSVRSGAYWCVAVEAWPEPSVFLGHSC